MSPIRHRLSTYSEPVFTRRRSIAFAVALVMLVSACSGGSSDSTPSVDISVPTVEFGPGANADGALRPVPNGFGFANFTAASVPSNEFSPADVVTMFGDGPTVCASGSGESCTLTAEAMSWVQMVNDTRQSGHCEGFIVQSLDKFRTSATPVAAELSGSGDVIQGIIRGFATQFIPEARGESRAWRKTKTADIVAELVTSLKSGQPKYVLGVYGDLGGHAILPYAVEFSDAANARIQVYDSNWPGRNRFVSVNVESGEWSFSFDGPDPENDPNIWTGGNGGMDLSSLSSRTGGTCPFCGDGTTAAETMLTIRATSLDWKVETERGTVNATTTVDGVDVSQVRAGITGVYDYVVTVDPALVDTKARDALRVTLPPKSVMYTVTPAGVGRVAATTKSGAVDVSETSLSTTDGLEVRLAAGDEAVLASNADEATVKIGNEAVSGTAVVAGKTVEATTTDDDNSIALVPSAGSVTARPLVLTPTPASPTELSGSLTATRLPDAETRLLSNITPDAPYVLPVAVATTTTAATTTTVATTTGGGQGATGVTTTTRPRTTTTVSGSTTTTIGTTATTVSSTTTAAPTTTSTSTTVANQAPVISTFSCAGRSASTIDFTVVATDPNGDTMTITFTDLSGNVWTNPATRSASNVSGSSYEVFRDQYGTSDFQVRVNVSDGISTTTLTRTWDGDYISNPSCTVVSTP